MRALLSALAVLAAWGLVGCRPGETPRVEAAAGQPAAPGRVILPPGSPKLRQIRVDAAGLREFPADELIAPGRVEVNPNRIARVTVPVAGRVTQVFVALGTPVRQGEALLTVDSAEGAAAIAACRQAQTQARMAASTLRKAESDLTRYRELHEHKAAALKDFQAAQNDHVQAQAAAEQAETALVEARHRLELFGLDPAAPSPLLTLRAPLSGKVLEISVVPGEYRSDTAAPAMTIADLSTIWMAAEVPESSIRLVHVGEAVAVELSAYPGETFRARVKRIADVVDPQTRTVKVHAEIGNPEGRLRPDMFARIRHSHGSRALPFVPGAAVVHSGGRVWVFVQRSPGEFERVAIQAGDAGGTDVPVLSGLKPGDRVVVDGAILLEALAGGTT